MVGVFANDRSPIGSGTARSIHAISTNDCIRLMGYSEPAENDDGVDSCCLVVRPANPTTTDQTADRSNAKHHAEERGVGGQASRVPRRAPALSAPDGDVGHPKLKIAIRK
jgi:hypothetical protein